MSIMIDLPPAMAQEELNRRHEVDAVMSKLDALAKKTSARLTGEAYKFNRADAYEPETTYA